MQVDNTDTAKSTQEQAVAAWVGYLNYLRFNELAERLANQDVNFDAAIEELQKLKLFVAHPEHIFGTLLQKHGEIAENVQVRFANAEQLIVGEEPIYSFDGVGRTAPEDYLRLGKFVQSKFYSGTSGTLYAIAQHNKTYPWFMQRGGTYEIPKSQFQELIEIYRSGESGAVLTDSDIKLYDTIKDWERINSVKFDEVIRPTVVDYEEVQLNTVNQTIQSEESKIREIDQERREEAYNDTKPTLKEGAQVAAVSAAVEGSIAFLLGVYKKRKAGKRLSQFTIEDWKELGLDTGKGTLKGAVRGSGIYVLTNYAAMPAPVASALITATLGMVAEAYKLEKGDITGENFIDACETICLDVTVSALSSVLGGMLIPVPVLGVVIGNATGMFMKNIAVAYLNGKEQQLIDRYVRDSEALKERLDDESRQVVEACRNCLSTYESIIELAFSPDVNKRLETSIEVARHNGVPNDKILTEEKGYAFFLNM